MIRAFAEEGGRLVRRDMPSDGLAGIVWLDLVAPSPEEIARVEAALGLDVPSWEEMQEIELSARLYHEDGAIYMTANLTSQTESSTPEFEPVSFILSGERLVSVRHHEPVPFDTFTQRAAATPLGCSTGMVVLIGLLESIIARVADNLERCGREIDGITREVFDQDKKSSRDRGLQHIIVEIGRVADLMSDIRGSLMSLERLIAFLTQAGRERNFGREVKNRIRTLDRDARSLGTHTGFLSEKTEFLLNATLGLVGVEQSGIIKIFSVVAVVFLPPTLIASIYGMNFRVMPELDWAFGYPMALGMMVVSAILPYLYFKLRGWL